MDIHEDHPPVWKRLKKKTKIFGAKKTDAEDGLHHGIPGAERLSSGKQLIWESQENQERWVYMVGLWWVYGGFMVGS